MMIHPGESPAALILAGVALCCAVVMLQFGRRSWAVAILVVGIGAPLIGGPPGNPAFLALLDALEIAVTAILVLPDVQAFRAWLSAHRTALHLYPPFRGTWVVAVGGPLPGINHHLKVSDQLFACDMMVAAGESRGREILSPCDGEVVATFDCFDDFPDSPWPSSPPKGTELGNHVVIRVAEREAFVFLCHLKKGSVVAVPGKPVARGDAVGKCGNSGRTTRAHLHIHVQNEPVYAFNRALGIPFKFAGAGGDSHIPLPRRRFTG